MPEECFVMFGFVFGVDGKTTVVRLRYSSQRLRCLQAFTEVGFPSCLKLVARAEWLPCAFAVRSLQDLLFRCGFSIRNSISQTVWVVDAREPSVMESDPHYSNCVRDATAA